MHFSVAKTQTIICLFPDFSYHWFHITHSCFPFDENIFVNKINNTQYITADSYKKTNHSMKQSIKTVNNPNGSQLPI